MYTIRNEVRIHINSVHTVAVYRPGRTETVTPGTKVLTGEQAVLK